MINAYKRNKIVYIAMLVCFLFAFIKCLFDAPRYVDSYSKNCIYIQIQNGDFNLFMFYLKIFLPIMMLFILSFLLSLNLYLFMASYVIMYIFIRKFFLYLFASCLISGICGYLCLILCWIPLIIVISVVYCKFFLKISEYICNCPHYKYKYITPYSCGWKKTRIILLKYILYTNIFALIYGSLLIAVLSLIY